MGIIEFIMAKNLFGGSGGSSGGNALCVQIDLENLGEPDTIGYLISSEVPAQADKYLCTLLSSKTNADAIDYYQTLKISCEYIPADEEIPLPMMYGFVEQLQIFAVIFDDFSVEADGATLEFKKGVYLLDTSLFSGKGLLLIVPNMEHL